MSTRIFEYPLQIKEQHLDTFGHVNNATYLTIYEEARWEFITENGYGLKEIMQTGLGPVILDIHISFKKELRLREHIIIHSESLGFESKVGKIRQWMTNEAGDLCSEIMLTVGLFDTKQRRLVEPTEAWIKATT